MYFNGDGAYANMGDILNNTTFPLTFQLDVQLPLELPLGENTVVFHTDNNDNQNK